MVYKTQFGSYVITKIIISNYQYGNRLALEMIFEDEDYGEEPFAVLTVNLPNYTGELEKDMAFVDINNLPEAEDFITKYKLGEFTGIYGESGFVDNYPLYKFDLERIKELSK